MNADLIRGPWKEDDHAAGALAGLRAAGYHVMSSDPDAFWAGWQSMERDAFGERYRGLKDLEGSDVVLGFLGRSHLGDVLCVSGLIRLLSEHYGCTVRSVRHRSTYVVLAENPWLAGYHNDDRVHMSPLARGPGHIIQKMQRYLGLPVDPFARPEVYLSAEETHWAWRQRQIFPRDRPVAIVCTNSVTDNRKARTGGLRWQEWADVLSDHFTVVQLALTRIEPLEESVRLHDSHRAVWRPDHILDGCLVYENLTTRRFMSLFSIADFYLGPNSSGAHLAAAFGVPALVVLNSKQYGDPPTFPDRIPENHWRHESFLYPYHSFLVA